MVVPQDLSPARGEGDFLHGYADHPAPFLENRCVSVGYAEKGQ